MAFTEISNFSEYPPDPNVITLHVKIESSGRDYIVGA